MAKSQVFFQSLISEQNVDRCPFHVSFCTCDIAPEHQLSLLLVNTPSQQGILFFLNNSMLLVIVKNTKVQRIPGTCLNQMALDAPFLIHLVKLHIVKWITMKISRILYEIVCRTGVRDISIIVMTLCWGLLWGLAAESCGRIWLPCLRALWL